MRRLLILVWLAVAAALGATPVVAAGGGPPSPAELVKATLLAEQQAVAPGARLWLDAHLEVKPGWHIYWRNPGDAGLPTTIAWTLPPGFAAGDMEWPVPERILVGKIGDYGYTGTVDLLVPVTAPQDLPATGAVPIQATVSWLACADICIPGDSRVELTLPVGSAAPDPATAPLFAAARRRLPQPATFETTFSAAPDSYHLFVPGAALAGLDDPAAIFFPYDGTLLDHAAAPKLRRTDRGIELVLAKAAAPSAKKLAAPDRLDGVLQLRGRDGVTRAFTIGATPVAAGAAAGTGGEAVLWWRALLLAFLGGLVLNLMPCVFPILSLKVLSFAVPAHAYRGERRRHGVAYAAGVLVSFAALGGALLALRAGGAAVGWGFQLQSPVVVALLAYLLLALGLSLSGVADFGMELANAGGRFARHPGLAGAFGTGVLATVVATPCTAPFMGTALGFALIAPPALALGIFLALGAGLAFPLLVASWAPGVHRLLPRPGRWMEAVKQLLAFGLYGTVAWLVWVLIQEVGPNAALAALFGLVVVGFAVWVYGRTRLARPGSRLAGSALATMAVVVAIVLSLTTASPEAAGPPAGAKAPQDGLAYQPFSPARLSALAAEHKPVFVNLTAAWCITCLVNERVTLDSTAVRQAFAAHGVVPLKGDWTNQNPDITRLLLRFGRSGVPLYLLYDANGAPQILPQILTEASVLDAVAKL